MESLADQLADALYEELETAWRGGLSFDFSDALDDSPYDPTALFDLVRQVACDAVRRMHIDLPRT